MVLMFEIAFLVVCTALGLWWFRRTNISGARPEIRLWPWVSREPGCSGVRINRDGRRLHLRRCTVTSGPGGDGGLRDGVTRWTSEGDAPIAGVLVLSSADPRADSGMSGYPQGGSPFDQSSETGSIVHTTWLSSRPAETAPSAQASRGAKVSLHTEISLSASSSP